jgi:thiol peroxidase
MFMPERESQTHVKERIMERTGVITFKGNGMTLLGPDVQVGEPAPDFTALNNALEPVSLSDFKGKVVIISVVPSVDTPVCEMQTKRFNEEANNAEITIITISMDLPFAQKRFCGANEIRNLVLLSDYKDHDFARKYGLQIKELGLLSRAVFVIDKEGKVAYKEICSEVTNHPDYDKALEAARSLA